MKKRIFWIGLPVVLAAVAYARYHGDEAEALPTVQQAPVTRGALVKTVKSIGTLQPLRTVRVGSQVSGTIKALYADFNSVVTKGQVLAELDPSLLQVEVSVQEANIARQENDIAQQQVQLANDQRNLERAQEEYDRGLVSLQQLETARLQVKTRASSIASAEKVKVQAEARLNQAKLNVSYCTLTSPVDGVVVSRLVDVGQTVQARGNVPQFFTIATDLSTLRLAAGVDEADIGQIRPRMPVTFNVDAYKGETFTGQVLAVRLNAQISSSVVTYPVWIEVPNADLRLRPSMTANLDIVVDSEEDAVLVPNDAVQFRPTPAMFAWLKVPAPEPGRAVRLASQQLAAGRAQNDEPAIDLQEADAERIDDLFATPPRRVTLGQVWVYDKADSDPARRFRPIPIRMGISDGQLTEVVSGDLAPGMEVVTAIEPPPILTRRAFGIFGGQQRSFGGMRPAAPKGPSRLNQRGNRNRGGGGRN